MTQFTAALATILLSLHSRMIRVEGFTALMQENCKACSGYPDQVEPIKMEVDSMLKVVIQLLDVFEKETRKC